VRSPGAEIAVVTVVGEMVGLSAGVALEVGVVVGTAVGLDDGVAVTVGAAWSNPDAVTVN